MTTALLLLFVVLFVVLAFEYINGFHDTANAIATVVSTKVLTPRQALVLASGMNLVGAFCGQAVAKTIHSGIIDDKVLYSGASLNDVYLQRHQRYRLDRYHLIQSRTLADSMATVLTGFFRSSAAVHPLDTGDTPKTPAIRSAIIRFRRALGKARHIHALHRGGHDRVVT